MELMVKVTVFGTRGYWKRLRNRVDLVLTCSFFVAAVLAFALRHNGTVVTACFYTERVIGVLRIIALPRNFGDMFPNSSAARLAKAARKILRSVYSLSVVFMCVGFAFASIAVLFSVVKSRRIPALLISLHWKHLPTVKMTFTL